MQIGEIIKKYRIQNNMTQKDLAILLEVEKATVSKYENGKLNPNIEVIKKLSNVYNITIDEMLSNEDNIIDLSKINVLEILKEQKDIKLKGNLYHNTQIAFTYNTNHMEGSTLSEEQTRNIFETSAIFFENKTMVNLNDIIETTNHFKLMDYVIDVANETLTENMIKKFHKILKSGTTDEVKEWSNVGEYKGLPNYVGNMKTTLPKNVKKDMEKLLSWYNALPFISINEIIEFHAKFEKIHPFQDGNGRVGRVIAFKECLKNNIIPFIILDKDKLYYYRGLNQYQTNNEKGYLIDTCLNAQDQYINMIKKYIINT